MKVNGQWIPCACNSSYSYIPILLKLYRCLDHALKICMWFGYNPHFNFYHFFKISGIYTKKVHVVWIYSRTCIKRPPKGRMENGLLMKVVF